MKLNGKMGLVAGGKGYSIDPVWVAFMIVVAIIAYAATTAASPRLAN